MKKAVNTFLILATGLLFACSNNPSSNDVTEPDPKTKQETITPSQPQQINYDTYVNQRYDYAIDYPTFLTPQPEAYNGDGRVFTNGDEEMKVYAMYNVLEQSIQDLKEFYESSIDGSIDYSVQKENWFILSGTNSDGNLYYMKTILTDDTEYTVQFTYPKKKKELYNVIVETVSKSFDVD